jgi:hypothetical protein
MFGSLLFLLALADTEIHRCRAADGTTVFQDRPCAVAPGGDRRSARTGPAAPEFERRAQTRGPVADRTAADERVLAACSERFLHCAGDGAAMDACVAAIRTCPAGGAACCPRGCLERYQRLRRAGESRPNAVRLALLDPDGPSCAVPGAR